MHLWPKGFAVEQFSKPRFSPLSFDHIIATMSSQTPSWFEEIKSDLATHRLFPFHQSRIFDSTAEIRKLAQLPTCVDWNWYVCQLTHLDESEQSRSTKILQSSHVHNIFRPKAYFLDKASKSAAASKCGCVRTWGIISTAHALPSLQMWTLPRR